MKKVKKIDIEKVYTKAEFIKKLRRLADSLESGKKFSIQVSGEKINVPENSIINIEHEKEKGEEDVIVIKVSDTAKLEMIRSSIARVVSRDADGAKE